MRDELVVDCFAKVLGIRKGFSVNKNSNNFGIEKKSIPLAS